MLLLIAMLSLGQLIAFAPISVAATPHFAEVPMAMRSHVSHDDHLSGSDHQNSPTHHLAGAHCLGCALASAGYVFRARATPHSDIITALPALVRSVRLTPFRPPITVST